jgi:hypothetical protein
VSQITFLTDFPEVAALGVSERRHGPVIDDQHVNATEPDENVPQTPVGSCDCQIAEQPGGTCVKRGVTVTTSLLR